MSMLYSFASGIAVRGGIEIGATLDLPDFEIYGSAYYGAYNLESKIAKYPRIVLGDELMNYVDLWRRSEDDSPQSKLNRTVGNMCLNMVCEDAGGRPISDFLSSDISAMFGPGGLKTTHDGGFLLKQGCLLLSTFCLKQGPIGRNPGNGQK